jgi:hypothetical protein
VCKGNNIRRDGKRRFVYLCICVFTNKITALGIIPKGRSIAHNIFNNQNAVFLSFDIETAGEIAGIVQIPAEIVRFKINSAKKKVPSTGTLTWRFLQNTGISTV